MDSYLPIKCRGTVCGDKLAVVAFDAVRRLAPLRNPRGPVHGSRFIHSLCRRMEPSAGLYIRSCIQRGIVRNPKLHHLGRSENFKLRLYQERERRLGQPSGCALSARVAM